MLEPIRDYQNSIVCYGDVVTGRIESKYKNQMTKTCLAIGGEFVIIRDNTETVIKRINMSAFEIHSYPKEA